MPLKIHSLTAATSLALMLLASPSIAATGGSQVRIDSKLQQVVIDSGSRQTKIPATHFPLESTCDFVDAAGNHLVTLVGEEGRGQQWQVGDKQGLLPTPVKVRDIALPPTATTCVIDPISATLFVNEEGVGLWAYPADAESETSRTAVLLESPYSEFKNIAAFTAVGGQVVVADPKLDVLAILTPDSKGVWKETKRIPGGGLDALDVEILKVRQFVPGTLTLHAIGDDGERDIKVPWGSMLDSRNATTAVPTVTVKPSAQTTPVARMGDAADDPAIWVHPRDARKSLVLGTDKKGGLQVFDLQGKRLQDLRIGRVNNVDVRSGRIGNRMMHIAAASNRDNETLHLFSIDEATGKVKAIGEVPTQHKEIYGLCMAKDRNGAMYVIANQKDSLFVQYRLEPKAGNGVTASKVREFKLGSQPEGCVSNDRTGELFVGEEAEGVYVLALDPNASTAMRDVIKVGDVLHKDVEGLAIYNGAKRDYLIVSSQGNDRYVVLDAQAPYQVRGIVRIMADARTGIDGASETDGLEVTSANLGGIYSQGMFVVQDGRKRMPEATQNFKYVPWRSIAEALKLD